MPGMQSQEQKRLQLRYLPTIGHLLLYESFGKQYQTI